MVGKRPEHVLAVELLETSSELRLREGESVAKVQLTVHVGVGERGEVGFAALSLINVRLIDLVVGPNFLDAILDLNEVVTADLKNKHEKRKPLEVLFPMAQKILQN